MQTIVLDATTKTLQAVLSGAPATTNPSYVVGWADDTGSALTEGASDGAFNGGTPVTITAAPAAATRRVIKSISIANIDTAPVTVTVSYNNNGTLRTIAVITLAVGDTWTNEGTFDTSANLKVTTAAPSSGLTIGSTTITSGTTTRILYDNAGVLGEYTLTGSGTVVVMATSPTLVTPVLGVATATSINGLTITSSTGTFTLTNAKTLAVTNSLTLSGTDGKTLTISNSGTLAGGDAFVLAIAAGKTLTVSNSITLAGTDATVMTFPTTSATIARTDAGQTFTGVQVMTSPSITTANLTGAQQLVENASIRLDQTLSADGTFTGITIAGTAGTTLAFGDLIYLAVADSRWELADADAAATSYGILIGMCVLAAAADGDPTVILLQGNIRADAAFPALTVGAAAYVGETAGDIQVAIPTGADNTVRVVGFALTADSLYFNPSSDSSSTVA